jgi:hypothetical protein
MKQIYDEEADIRTSSAIKVMSLIFIGIIIIATTTNPIATGTDEGERAPQLEGKMYNGSGWAEFDLDSYWDYNWDSSDMNGVWMLLEFMDIDCPYCIQSASEMGANSLDFSSRVNQWDGALVNFVASATELSIENHDSSRSEIVAFRDKTDNSGQKCAGSACESRPGAAHTFPYIDDLDQDNMKEWKVSGTPSYYLIQPDGIIAWSSSQHPNEEVRDAIISLCGKENFEGA